MKRWPLRWVVFRNMLIDRVSQWLVWQLPSRIVVMATLHLWATVSSSDDFMDLTMHQAVAKWQEKQAI